MHIFLSLFHAFSHLLGFCKNSWTAIFSFLTGTVPMELVITILNLIFPNECLRIIHSISKIFVPLNYYPIRYVTQRNKRTVCAKFQFINMIYSIKLFQNICLIKSWCYLMKIRNDIMNKKYVHVCTLIGTCLWEIIEQTLDMKIQYSSSWNCGVWLWHWYFDHN